MYTRDYSERGETEIIVPEKYGGVAFAEELAPPKTEEREENEVHNEKKEEKEESAEVGNFGKDAGFLSGILKFLPKKLTETGLPFFKGGIKSFGTEELLIIALALFLFFSKDGDKECAIMLAILLFL